MTIYTAMLLVVVFLLFVYLLCALLRPEKF
jgi:K+-transporting ATPase KdpF subunit